MKRFMNIYNASLEDNIDLIRVKESLIEKAQYF